MSKSAKDIPIVILSGGKGMYIDASGERTAKGNVVVAGAPLIHWVIKSYTNHGFRRFVVSGALQNENTINLLKNFWNLKAISNTRFDGKNGSQEITIDFVTSDPETLTAERVRLAREFIKDDSTIGVTYSDTIAPINFTEALESHFAHQKMATVTAARLPTRFRVLGIRPGENLVRGFGQPFLHGHYINGGFYFFNKEIWSANLLGNTNLKVLETDILDSLAKTESLVAYPHEGPWQHLDSERDLNQLQKIAQEL